MLIKLGENIRRWKPLPGKSLTPIDAVRAAWPNIVGVDVAKHCLPSEVRGEMLLVITRSGTWSQQLGFLEANILAEIARLDDDLKISELKFRVGKIAQQISPQRAKIQRAQTVKRHMTTLQPEVSLEEMVARARMQAEKKHNRRGPRCSRCAVSLEQGNLCAPCRDREAEARIHTVMRILSEAPWLSDEEIRRSAAHIRESDTATARRRLSTRWKRDLDRLERKKKFSAGEPERAIAVAYVVLMTGVPPDQLSRAITRYTLGPRVDMLLYGEFA